MHFRTIDELVQDFALGKNSKKKILEDYLGGEKGSSTEFALDSYIQDYKTDNGFRDIAQELADIENSVIERHKKFYFNDDFYEDISRRKRKESYLSRHSDEGNFVQRHQKKSLLGDIEKEKKAYAERILDELDEYKKTGKKLEDFLNDQKIFHNEFRKIQRLKRKYTEKDKVLDFPKVKRPKKSGLFAKATAMLALGLVAAMGPGETNTVYESENQNIAYNQTLQEDSRDDILSSLRSVADDEGISDYNLDYESLQDQHKFTLTEITDDGNIPVFMFHGIDTDGRYSTSSENVHRFFRHLDQFNYFPVSVDEFAQHDFSEVPDGMYPCLITLDDADSGNFDYLTDENGNIIRDEDGVAKIDTDSFYSIASEYLQRNSEGKYPVHFAVSFDALPFRQSGNLPVRHSEVPYENDVVDEKLDFLVDNAYIGNHTKNHASPNDYENPEEYLEEEIIGAHEIFEHYLGEKSEQIRSIAYPYGIMDDDVIDLVRENTDYDVGFAVLGKVSESPLKRETLFDIERLGINDEELSYVLGAADASDKYINRQIIEYFDRDNDFF